MLNNINPALALARRQAALRRQGPRGVNDPIYTGPRFTQGYSGQQLGPEWRQKMARAEARARALRRHGARDVEPPI